MIVNFKMNFKDIVIFFWNLNAFSNFLTTRLFHVVCKIYKTLLQSIIVIYGKMFENS